MKFLLVTALLGLCGCAEVLAAMANTDHHSSIVGQQRAQDAATMQREWQNQQIQNQQETQQQNQRWGR